MFDDDISRLSLLTRRECVVGGLTAAAGTVLVGCGSSSSTGSASGSSSAPQRGGHLRGGFTGGTSADTLNPLKAIQNLDFIRIANLYDPLVKFSPTGEPTLVLAKELIPNSKATEWTLTIHDGIEFHNGKSLTADDVVYTFQQMLSAKTPGWMAPFFAPVDVARVRKVSAHTVSIGCSRPFSILPQALAISGASDILPVGYNEHKPVGTGAFKMGSFTPGQQSTFVRNPNYWVSGLPYLDQLVITDFSDETSQSNALQSGSVDVIGPLSVDSIAPLQGSGATVVIGSSYEGVMITMRVDIPPFNDVRVRQALRLTTNRPQAQRLVFGGHGSLGNDILGYGAPEYDFSLPQREQDIEQAKALLKAAGKEGLHVTLTTAPIIQGTVELAQVVANDAAAAGIHINLFQTTPTNLYGPQYLKWAFAQDYNFFTYLFPAVGLFLIPGGPFNETHFNDPQLTSLFNAGLSAVDAAKRRQIGHEICNIQYTRGPYLIPLTPPVVSAAGSHVHGLYPGKSGITPNYGIFNDVWIAS